MSASDDVEGLRARVRDLERVRDALLEVLAHATRERTDLARRFANLEGASRPGGAS